MHAPDQCFGDMQIRNRDLGVAAGHCIDFRQAALRMTPVGFVDAGGGLDRGPVEPC